MKISRIRVTGGFLSGVDISLNSGLNVVIGPRGAGKTTLLELLRHALGVSHADAPSARKHQEFVRAILGSGEVIVDLECDGEAQRIAVDATGTGRKKEYAVAALMLAQNELEAIASNRDSRLNLIDLRANISPAVEVWTKIEELTRRAANYRDEIEASAEILKQRLQLNVDLDKTAAREQELLRGGNELLSKKRQELTELERSLLNLKAELRGLSRSHAQFTEVGIAVEQVQALLSDALDTHSSRSSTIPVRTQRVLNIATELSLEIAEIRAQIAARRNDIDARTLSLREFAEPIRAELETAESGLGAVTAEMRNIRSQLAMMDEQEKQLLVLQNQYKETIRSRDELMSRLESGHEYIFQKRAAVAAAVNDQLDGHVVVTVDHLADHRSFSSMLERALQGSNTQYRSAIESIVSSVLPGQLLKFLST
ncbi:hypothetical protein DL991_14185 [Amycolatopsis sp. WAC 01375]|uniref:ATP-binding protein n=1 Tax=Amycolatopsis sp. WAC 01375 TaxID=2203194 RepID=UPI000F7B5D5C|nr:ATP-binding protein [Amycolatopsis sp. WAC 01375]RSM79926.1 hypothetical protein DL991_14185 [Amycolatopsis sp. WAC 01375]